MTLQQQIQDLQEEGLWVSGIEQMTEIILPPSNIEIIPESDILYFDCWGYYDSKSDIIRLDPLLLCYHPTNIPETLDHEEIHRILFHFITADACKGFDYICGNYESTVNLLTKESYPRLSEYGMMRNLTDARKWFR